MIPAGQQIFVESKGAFDGVDRIRYLGTIYYIADILLVYAVGPSKEDEAVEGD